MEALPVTAVILLVEDEALIALNERLTLEKKGFTVRVAHSGEEALAIVDEDDSLDLVLMDIDLGQGMDGTEAAQRILEIKELPIVFLTSHAEQEMVRKVRGITQYGYILKSSGEFVLIQAIQIALDLFEAHRKLKRSEERYRTMIETAPMPFQSLNSEGRLIDVNRAWLRTLGYDRDEVLGTWFGDLLHPDQVELFRERFPRFKSEGEIQAVEFLMRHADGGYRNTLFNGCIAYTEVGNFSHTVCVFEDVTERRKVEEAHRASEARLQSILNSAPIGIGVVRQRVIQEVNDRVCGISGYEKEELLGRSVRIFYETEEEYKRVGEAKYRLIDEAGVGTVETRWVRKDGAVIDILLTSTPIEAESREGDVIFTAFDMSDYKESQRGLRKALQEKEQLMKELNHRVKNNLNMVASLINLKEGALPESVDLSDLQNQIDAIRTVHEKLAQTEGALSINMKSYLADLLDAGFHWPQASEPPKVELNIEEAILPAKTAAAVGLIVNELATNAAKHGFPGTESPILSVAFHHDREASEYELNVSNSGKPFPDHVTPDDPSSGGLGLQLISAMVETLEGRITLQRDPVTAISIRLPAPEDGQGK